MFDFPVDEAVLALFGTYDARMMMKSEPQVVHAEKANSNNKYLSRVHTLLLKRQEIFLARHNFTKHHSLSGLGLPNVCLDPRYKLLQCLHSRFTL
jgi:hypothetical protein